jgi:hypothetical protein
MYKDFLTKRYENEIDGVLGCYDRVIIRGTPGSLGYANGMTMFFNAHHFKIFDFHKIFTPITETIKSNLEKIAAENNIEIEYVRKSGAFRKDDKIAKIIEERGTDVGLVHIFSQLEILNTFDPWYDKSTTRCYFKPASTKRLVYYVYFIDELLGLCYLKIPTIAPFALGFYFNGHSLLETKLNKAGISFTKQENAFLSISDFKKAQMLSDNIKVEDIHKALDAFAKRYCSLPDDWNVRYQWSLSEVEYSYDIIFKSAGILKPIYDNIITTAMHTITPENIANFLGKRFSLQFEGEAGSRYNKRILGIKCTPCQVQILSDEVILIKS